MGRSRLGIGAAVILGGGIPLAISSGIIAFLAYSSIVAALYAIFVSMKSLQLTRATQRPFLNVTRISVHWSGDSVHPSPLNYIFIGISNTGNFPADNVSFLFNVWRSKNKRKHLLQMEAADTSIYFPNVDNPNLMFREASKKNRLIANLGDKIRVQIEIGYYNKLTKTTHKTVRSYLTEYNPTAHHEPTPIPEADYWD